MPLTFSTVIATRNRSDVLAVSLPLHLQQSRLPEQIIIVDSSDDMTANKELVERLDRDGSVPVKHIPSAAGSSLQRNIGMREVTSDVIFFPDDDSILYPDTLAHMMRIYELDTEGHIGGVTTSTATMPPEGILADTTSSVARDARPSWLRLRAHDIRHALETTVFQDPTKLAAARFYELMPPAESWFSNENAIRIWWMMGYRMSFRHASIQKAGFNETLGRYAMGEDVDASLQVLRGGQSLVVARNALIYHHRAPERRMHSRQYGAVRVLNNAYVTMRTGIADRSLKSATRRHEWFKSQYIRADRKGKYGREQYLGARDALRVLPELLASPPEQLDETYLALRRRCLGGDES